MKTMNTIEIKTLVAQNLTKTFSQGKEPLHVLKHVNITFEKGKNYAITGASGSGKSTLLHLLGSLDEPTSGNVLFCGQDLFKISPQKRELILNQQIGFVFQFHYLIHELTILENIILPGKIANKKNSGLVGRGNELLKLVGLSDKANNYPSELSGGEQQRVSILRAIFNKPDFLLADEPTGNLDEANAKNITDLLLEFQKEWGMGIILCSHDKAVYQKMEFVFELHEGQIKK
jgi:ABC-type lipoprotein export system ATPase subunit